jgi:hypothetical protein
LTLQQLTTTATPTTTTTQNGKVRRSSNLLPLQQCLVRPNDMTLQHNDDTTDTLFYHTYCMHLLHAPTACTYCMHLLHAPTACTILPPYFTALFYHTILPHYSTSPFYCMHYFTACTILPHTDRDDKRPFCADECAVARRGMILASNTTTTPIVTDTPQTSTATPPVPNNGLRSGTASLHSLTDPQ